jgi:hypothetical protein
MLPDPLSIALKIAKCFRESTKLWTKLMKYHMKALSNMEMNFGFINKRHAQTVREISKALLSPTKKGQSY